MKRGLSILLALALIFCLAPAAMAATDEAVEAAERLYAQGLFKGVGTNADGTPNFALDKLPTRAEGVTMLVRLMGEEEAALAGTWTTPFVDVASWAAPYVGYAYEKGLTKGVSETRFCGEEPIAATQYLTLVLRALGYEDGRDFQWDKAWVLTDQLGVTQGQYTKATAFTRGDVAVVSLGAYTVSQVLETAPYWGLPRDIRWVSQLKTEEDWYNNILYSFLFGNYSLHFSNTGVGQTAVNVLRGQMWERIKTLSCTYPELVGVVSNAIVGCGIRQGELFIDFPQASLTTETMYDQQLAALEAAQAMKDTLHKEGKITPQMSQKQIAQVYYDALSRLGVSPGGGEETAKQGKSVEYDSPYACLVNRKADCVGRAGAFNLLMHLEGISAQGVSGQIKGTNSGHVLSRVVLDGTEYFCDWGNGYPLAQDIGTWFQFDKGSLEAARAIA